MKHLIRVIISFIAIAIIVIILFTILINTNFGLRWSIALIQRAIPGKLQAQNIQGHLTGPITIQSLHYEQKDYNFTINNFSFNWSPKDLLIRKLNVNKLTANNISINFVNTSKSDTSINYLLQLYRDTHLPIKLNLHNIELDKITISHPQLKPLIIDKITLTLSTANKQINYIKFNFDSALAKININGELKQQYNFTWQATIANLDKFSAASTGQLETHGAITGNRNTPEIAAYLSGSQLKTANVKIADLTGTANIIFSPNKKSQINITAAKINFHHYNINSLKLDGDLTFTSLNRTNTEAIINLQSEPTTISLVYNYQVHQVALNSTKLTMIANKKGLVSQVIISPQHSKPLHAKITLEKFRNLQGEITWHTNDLSFLHLLFPHITKADGDIDVAIKLAGTLQQPQIYGYANLTNAAAYIDELNINLKNINLQTQCDNQILKYKGSATSGDGKLDITGTTTRTDKPKTMLKIIGKNLLVSDVIIAKIYASPNLQLSYLDNRLDINGEITIPTATINPRDYRSTVTLPQDVVFTDKTTQQEITKSDIMQLFAKVQLILGDKVYVNVMGLTGQLLGSVTVDEQPQRLTTAIGTLKTKNAVYNAFGQDLKINYGSLSFSGGPATNPILNIEAVRNIRREFSTSAFSLFDQDITVGAHIQGKLRHPKTTLFSIPAGLSNADILSYMVLGRASSDINENKAEILFKAASSLNFGGSGGMSGLTDALRKKFGFSEIGFESEPTAASVNSNELQSNTSFVLGKYLSPSLYISYSIGLINPVNTIRIRYKFGKYWAVQSESSTIGTGADLLYSIEHK